MTDKPPERKPFSMQLNPDYGQGAYRRRVRLQHEAPDRVLAELEDDNHGIRLILLHDGKKITAIQSDTRRLPMTTCQDASQVLAQLAGVPLSVSPRSLGAHANPKSHCTHQFDLLSLAVTHALRAEPQRQYDVAFHDERDGLQTVEGDINGEPVFRWTVRRDVIETDGAYKGISLHKGFANWAEQNMSPDELELALLIQRGMLVSTTRRVNVDYMAGMGLEDDPMTKGVCYSYNAPAIQYAVRFGGTARDFTHTPEQLLRFV
jgi:hypothetical protein